jgi:hypothetical protein
MKTILKVTFLFALVVLANTLFAAGNLKVNIIPLNAEKAVVAISTLANSNFNITIVDDKDQIVYYQENMNPDETYSKVYNFSNLEDGTYKLTVVSDNLTAERQFKKSHQMIKVGKETTTLEPFFRYDGNILRCSYLNFETENTTLLFYQKDQLIYSKNIGKNFNIQQRLNLSKLSKGNYEAVLCAGSKTFSYPVEIQ